MVLHELRRGNLGNELGVTSTSGSQLSNSNGYNSNLRGGILGMRDEVRSGSERRRRRRERVPGGLGGSRVGVGVEDTFSHNSFLQIAQMSLLEVGCVVFLPVFHNHQSSKWSEVRSGVWEGESGIRHEDGLLEDGEGLREILGQFLSGEVFDSTRVGVHVQLHLQDSFSKGSRIFGLVE